MIKKIIVCSLVLMSLILFSCNHLKSTNPLFGRYANEADLKVGFEDPLIMTINDKYFSLTKKNTNFEIGTYLYKEINPDTISIIVGTEVNLKSFPPLDKIKPLFTLKYKFEGKDLIITNGSDGSDIFLGKWIRQ